MSKKRTLNVGVDVGAKVLHVVLYGSDEVYEFTNDAEGHQKLLKFVRKKGTYRHVVLESTGVYGLDVALVLHRAKNFTVHYLNPVRAKGFMQAKLQRAKSDPLDAKALAALGATMELPVWQPPSDLRLTLRSAVRRVRQLVKERTREKNRLAAAKATATTLPAVLDDLAEHIAFLDRRIQTLEPQAWELARQEEELASWLDTLKTISGIGKTTALYLVAELACWPADLTPAQFVAQAGLDPRLKQSGMRDAPRRISKMGTPWVRSALHMAVHNGILHSARFRALFERLHVQKGKHRLVAHTALARKLLVVIHALLRDGAAFDPNRFGSLPEKSPA